MVDITVIIPTSGRREKLRLTLDSVFAQDHGMSGVEIIIVDDMNDGGLALYVESLRVKHGLLRYVSQSRKGPAAARNLGFSMSSGTIVAFTDDDCLLSKDWVRLMLLAHKNNPDAAAVGGLTLVDPEKISVSVSQFLSNSSITALVNGRKEVIFFPTCNVSFKREVLLNARFDERFRFPGGEDLELCWRLFKEGKKLVFDGSITVFHDREGSFLGFLRQSMIYGRGNFLVSLLCNDHPLLKELNNSGRPFWATVLLNILKIPRFSFLMGKRFLERYPSSNMFVRSAVYIRFAAHKISYILGTVIEYRFSRKNPVRSLAPRLLIVVATNNCNLSCRICSVTKESGKVPDIEAALLKKILSQAHRAGIRELALSGGEPLLRNDIFEIFDHARSVGIKYLGVLTNGIAVSSLLARLIPYLKDNTVSLCVSFDSLSPGPHNKIRNSSSAWSRTRESLFLLAESRRKYPGIVFNVLTIIFNDNLHELKDLADFVRSLGANYLQFQPMLSDNLRLSKRTEGEFLVKEDRFEALDKAIDDIVSFRDVNPGFIMNSRRNLELIKKYYRGTLAPGDVSCSSAEKTVFVSLSGECISCNLNYGDFRKQDISEILVSESRSKAQLLAKKCLTPCLLPCVCDI